MTMASNDVFHVKCPICDTDLLVKISYGIYPMRSEETADCPVCGKEVLRKNITGDIVTEVESLANTKEQYKVTYKPNNVRKP